MPQPAPPAPLRLRLPCPQLELQGLCTALAPTAPGLRPRLGRLQTHQLLPVARAERRWKLQQRNRLKGEQQQIRGGGRPARSAGAAAAARGARIGAPRAAAPRLANGAGDKCCTRQGAGRGRGEMQRARRRRRRRGRRAPVTSPWGWMRCRRWRRRSWRSCLPRSRGSRWQTPPPAPSPAPQCPGCPGPGPSGRRPPPSPGGGRTRGGSTGGAGVGAIGLGQAEAGGCPSQGGTQPRLPAAAAGGGGRLAKPPWRSAAAGCNLPRCCPQPGALHRQQRRPARRRRRRRPLLAACCEPKPWGPNRGAAPGLTTPPGPPPAAGALTLPSSTFSKPFTTLSTRSVTSPLSRKLPAASPKPRQSRRLMGAAACCAAPLGGSRTVASTPCLSAASV